MKTDINKQGIDVSWRDLTPGCEVMGGGTAEEFNTGEWRVDTPVVDMTKCKQCLICALVCPDGAIFLDNFKRGEFDLKHCKGCGICAKACPFDAITMKVGEK